VAGLFNHLNNIVSLCLLQSPVAEARQKSPWRHTLAAPALEFLAALSRVNVSSTLDHKWTPRVGTDRKQRTAQILIALGSLILLVGSALHLAGGYPIISSALAKSNLDGGTRNALRAIFLMIGLTWIVVALVTLVAAFAITRTSKAVTLLCGFALLLQVPIWMHLMGWFVGNEMFLLGSGLIVSGGLWFRRWRST
jgi:hypothetical protein